MEMKVTNEQLKKIRAFCGQMVENNPPLALRREVIDLLDAAIAAAEPEPVAYWDGESLALLPADLENIPNWSDYYRIPLYRHPAPQSQPVARVTGYYGGNCVIEPLDGKTVFSSGMAVYSAPVAAQSAEPVAEVLMHEGEKIIDASMAWMDSTPIGTQLYAAPPSRKWQGLTEDERATLLGMGEYMTLPMKWTFAHAIEDALRAKNSGEQA